MSKPTMSNRGFQDLSQGHDLVVQSAAGGPLRFACLGIDPGGHAVHTVVLDFASRDLGYRQIPEEGNQVNPKSDSMAFYPAWTPLPLGDDFVFFQKLLGHRFKRLSRPQDTRAIFAAKGKEPVLGDLFR